MYKLKDKVSSKEKLAQRVASFDWAKEAAELSERLSEQVKKSNQLVQRLKLQLEQSPTTGGDSTSKTADGKAERERVLKARAKVRDLETQLRKLQDEVKQKEASLELKSKELIKCQRSKDTVRGEIAKVDKQRESQEFKLTKLKEELESKCKESKDAANRFEIQVQQLQRELEDERITRQELQVKFDQFKAKNEKLEEKCQQLLEVQNKEKQILPDDQYSDYEIELFKELKETQELLREKDKIIEQFEAERQNILAAVNAENAPGQTSEDSKEGLTAQLLTTMDELHNVRKQFQQVQKNYKRMRQRAEHFEKKLTEINEFQQKQINSGSRQAREVQLMRLQQQVTDLSSSLTEVNERNVELEKNYSRLQIKLDHYKRHMRNYDKDRQLRKDMQMLIQHKDDSLAAAEAHIDILDQKTDSFDQLYEALEQKELQVMKLETLVKQMEKQEDCLQAQRTRLENRIAKLEFELKESQQAHRNRGFSFL